MATPASLAFLPVGTREVERRQTGAAAPQAPTAGAERVKTSVSSGDKSTGGG